MADAVTSWSLKAPAAFIKAVAKFNGSKTIPPPMPDDVWNDSPPVSPGPAPPDGSTIEIVERSADRLVLFIPSGGRRGMEFGCFAIVWLGIVSVITVGMLGGLGNRNQKIELTAFLFILPFWAVGLTMLYVALRMRFQRTLLLVEPGRAVLQQTLFGRTTTKETSLPPGVGATLVESYRQNDVPVDAVCLAGPERKLKFATPLKDAEKNWLVDRINEFLNIRSDDSDTAPVFTFPEKCTQCGGVLGSAADANELGELKCTFCGHLHRGEITMVRDRALGLDTTAPQGDFPAERVTIVEQTPDRLEFTMRAFDNRGMRRGAGAFFAIFALIWNSVVFSIIGGALFGARVNAGVLFPLIFLIPFLLIGLGVAGVAVFILFGSLRAVVDREQLTARWGIGPLGLTKKFNNDFITHVTVQNSPFAVKNERRRRSSGDTETQTAIVWAGPRWIPVTMLQNVNDCRHVAALVRNQLAGMGIKTSDTPPAASIAPFDEATSNSADDDDDDSSDDEITTSPTTEPDNESA